MTAHTESSERALLVSLAMQPADGRQEYTAGRAPRLVWIGIFGMGIVMSVSAAALAQQAPPPVGYLVYYGRSDGQAFADGKKFRIHGVTKNWAQRMDWVKNINSIHMYRAYVKELATDTQYQQALMDPWKLLGSNGSPGASGNVRPEQSVAGTKWEYGPGEYLWFNANGTFQIGESKGITSNTFGTWSQNGAKISLRSNRFGEEIWTLQGNSLAYGLRKIRKL